MSELLQKFLAWAEVPGDGAEYLTWELHPYTQDEEVCAIVACKGAEIHSVIAPEWRNRLIQRRKLQQFYKPMFDKLGFLTTKSFSDDEKTARLLTRLGFERSWQDGQIQHWMLTALPWT